MSWIVSVSTRINLPRYSTDKNPRKDISMPRRGLGGVRATRGRRRERSQESCRSADERGGLQLLWQLHASQYYSPGFSFLFSACSIPSIVLPGASRIAALRKELLCPPQERLGSLHLATSCTDSSDESLRSWRFFARKQQPFISPALKESQTVLWPLSNCYNSRSPIYIITTIVAVLNAVWKSMRYKQIFYQSPTSQSYKILRYRSLFFKHSFTYF